MPALCVLYLAALLGAFVRLAESAGPVVRCEPCDAGALLQCKPLPKDCVERVREPGCGCCMTCALGEGQACGVYTGRCGSGLTCQHQPGESRPLQALLEGRGVCSSAATRKLSSSILIPPIKPGRQTPNTSPLLQATPALCFRTQPTVYLLLSLSSRPVFAKHGCRKSQSHKVETVSGGANTDIHNFSLESKRETEYGPCRREMESILNSLKISNVLNPRGFRIPNCDKKGFYKKKQCRPSKGRKRGYCWCVDKYGQPLPAYDGKERGEMQCYSLESI
uniref:Insulin-like growth factor-binding protein 3 n=1 Tax=Gadus morhua TaxID=8049 RepID=A0A8C4ZML4_GADMO